MTAKRKPNHHFGRRKAEGTHAAPEYTANGAGIGARDDSWPDDDKFLAYMQRNNIPRFENITKQESRQVLLRLVTE